MKRKCPWSAPALRPAQPGLELPVEPVGPAEFWRIAAKLHVHSWVVVPLIPVRDVAMLRQMVADRPHLMRGSVLDAVGKQVRRLSRRYLCVLGLDRDAASAYGVEVSCHPLSANVGDTHVSGWLNVGQQDLHWHGARVPRGHMLLVRGDECPASPASLTCMHVHARVTLTRGPTIVSLVK